MNGIYRITYQVPGDSGIGLSFLDNGKIYGGDESHAFYGEYSVVGDNLTANVTRVQHSSGHALGGGGNQLTITGKVNGDNIRAQAAIPGVSVTMAINMQKLTSI